MVAGGDCGSDTSIATRDGLARFGLAGLAGIGLLLFVLATAHTCYALRFEFGDGDYSGAALTAGAPAGPDPSNHVEMVYARTRGYETCFPEWGGSQEDWDSSWVMWKPTKELFTYAAAEGSGGYNDDWWDCLVCHTIETRGDYEWKEDGEFGDTYRIKSHELMACPS